MYELCALVKLSDYNKLVHSWLLLRKHMSAIFYLHSNKHIKVANLVVNKLKVKTSKKICWAH